MDADERRRGEDEEPLAEVTRRIIGCVIRVSNGLGTGFLEKVYENALALELRNAGLKVEQQKPIEVRYSGAVVGEYTADLLVEDSVLIELKVVRQIDNIHKAQCLNYLRATGLKVCLLINFYHTKATIKRLSLTR
jgi:GxxExxY protein